MTYNYTLDTFLSTPTSDDWRLMILDKNGNYVDTLTTDLSHFFVSNNCLVIKINNKNDLILSFQSKVVAQLALQKLDEYRKILLNNQI